MIGSAFLQVEGQSDAHGAGGDGVENAESDPSADTTVHVKDSDLLSSTYAADAIMVSVVCILSNSLSYK